MVEAIKSFFLDTVGKELCVFFCSMIPVIELRGAIPMGVAFGLPWWLNYILCVVGNMVPVPIILIFVNGFIKRASNSKIKLLNKVSNMLLRKIEKKRNNIEKYSFWGVCFFVAIPLPATGAWTGSLVAAAIDMKFWKAMLSAFLGVCIAGSIMLGGSYLVPFIWNSVAQML